MTPRLPASTMLSPVPVFARGAGQPQDSRLCLSSSSLLVVLVLVVLCGAATCGLDDSSTLPPPALDRIEVLGTHEISEQGTIRLPLVGPILAAGLSPDELSTAIAVAYNGTYLKKAEVSLFIKERNSQKVFVLGQVGKPGPVPIAGRRITVIEAIAQAGGTGKLADAGRVVLTREKDGKQIRVTVDVGAIGKGLAPDVEMQPGDILFVPETLF